MRRLFVALIGLLLFVGCGRIAPGETAPPTPSAAGPLVVATTADPTTTVIAQLYVQALSARGVPARLITVDDDPSRLVSRIQAGEVDLAPVFAWTAAQALGVDNDEPGSLVADLAAALDGEVAVVQASTVDRAWTYRTASQVASLDAVRTDVSVVGPQAWREAPDGPRGLSAVYGAKPSVDTVEAPAERLARAVAGDVAVFDGTEPEASDPRLKDVADPRSMISPNLQVALLTLDRQTDDVVVGGVAAVQGVLDNATVAAIRQRTVSAGVEGAVHEWLAAHPLP